MRTAIDLAYRVRQAALAWLKWPTRGVKATVFDNQGRLLLIRDRYGNAAAFVLPGAVGLYHRLHPRGVIPRSAGPNASGNRSDRR